jgi:hypothetical protein
MLPTCAFAAVCSIILHAYVDFIFHHKLLGCLVWQVFLSRHFPCCREKAPQFKYSEFVIHTMHHAMLPCYLNPQHTRTHTHMCSVASVPHHASSVDAALHLFTLSLVSSLYKAPKHTNVSCSSASIHRAPLVHRCPCAGMGRSFNVHLLYDRTVSSYLALNPVCTLITCSVYSIYTVLANPIYMLRYRVGSTDREGLTDLARVLGLLVKAMSLVGLVAVSLGPPHAHIVVRLIYGQKWAQTEAPAVLSVYCLYILLLALNGETQHLKHTHTHTHARAHTHTHIHTHTYTQTYAHKHTLAHAHSIDAWKRARILLIVCYNAA